jgi:peptide/nickel transport system permease protein
MYWKFILKRILNAFFMYAILIFVVSALFNVVAEQTIYATIEENVAAEVQAAMSTDPHLNVSEYRQMRYDFYFKSYHLDKSVVERILWRTKNALTFNFGRSIFMKSTKGSREVFDIVAETIPKSLILFTTAVFVQVTIGVLLGLKKAQKAGSTLDKTTSTITMVIFGMPSWWLGMVFIMFFAYELGIAPSGGMISKPVPEGFAYALDFLKHLMLPLFTLVCIGFWGMAFITRNIVLGTLHEDYIMAARARGIKESSVVYKHTLRSSAPPIVTMSVLSILSSIGGNLLFEGIFSWPGMGNLYWSAIAQNDVPVLIGNLSLTIGLYLIGLVILDLIYGLLDPRIKVSG